MSSQTDATSEAQDRGNVIHYSVNGEPQESTEHKLTVREILENAGFAPAEDYQLTRDQNHHTFESLDEKVTLHKGESFTATFVGTTPVS